MFVLLQNVYQAFDVIAKRRNVFKVETIGDSYGKSSAVGFGVFLRFHNPCRLNGRVHVGFLSRNRSTTVAVTGLPEPQEYHACIMAKFAFECLVKVNQVMKELEIQLGPDTGELGMRFGLHSGPVTAGVLKGERARFQLFGDTVNTGTSLYENIVDGRMGGNCMPVEVMLNLYAIPISHSLLLNLDSISY